MWTEAFLLVFLGCSNDLIPIGCFPYLLCPHFSYQIVSSIALHVYIQPRLQLFPQWTVSKERDTETKLKLNLSFWSWMPLISVGPTEESQTYLLRRNSNFVQRCLFPLIPTLHRIAQPSLETAHEQICLPVNGYVKHSLCSHKFLAFYFPSVLKTNLHW